MADAACAEEEEGLKRILARAQNVMTNARSTLETIRRVEAGDITVNANAVLASRDAVLSAMENLNVVLAYLDEASDELCNNISACRGCPK